VKLPEKPGTLPEPLPAGLTEPGFKLRGIKGWMWKPEQYLAEIPVLAAYKMNFLMNCYTSMCDVENYRWGEEDCNRWWEALPEAKKKAYEEIVRSCANHGIEFCFSMNPNLSSKRFADPDSPDDVDSLWQHYRWMQRLGVSWFNISLDDIRQGIDAKKQAQLVNIIFRRLRATKPDARMIFCPTFYWGDGSAHGAEEYLRSMAAELDTDVYVFWTGDRVVTPRITRRAAESYRKLVAHRMVLWDNYPVNDNTPTMHLGPVSGRDADLCEVLDGYMSNPLCPQNEINRIPMLTCADYAYNPRAYEPGRSIGQSIVHNARTKEQRDVLKDVVEAYPGMLLYDRGTSFNPVRERAAGLAGRPGARHLKEACLAQAELLLRRFRSAFPDRYRDCAQTLADDVEWLQANLEE
jgi:hyaluronoglucosaminidase